MKLEVGMYVRTNKGIAKIIKIFANGDEPYDNVKYELDRYLEIYYDSQYVSDDYIVKTSYNIIDILEENDYINGLRIEKNKYGELYTSYVYYGGDIGKQCEVYTTWLKELKEDMIYSIVTHEQMEQIAYKVGE